MPRANRCITRRAITLAELLVVLGILTVLAAIALPVVAGARASAKAARVGARFHQVALAAQLYIGDHDHQVMMHGYVRRGEREEGIADPYCAWPHQIQAYAHEWSIFQDESVPDPMKVWSDSRVAWWYNWQKWPALGLNVNYLNNAGGDCSRWAELSGMDAFGPPISTSQVENAPQTVFFAGTKRVGRGRVAFFSHTVEAPASVRAADTCTFTNGGWGLGSFGDAGPEYPGNPTSTGDFSVSHLRGGLVLMLDGSARWMLPEAAAAGTNWRRGIRNHEVVVTRPEQYVWDTR